MRLRQFLAASCVAASGVLAAVAAHAEAYPSKVITMVVPWPAGGATDSVGRLLAAELKISLGQTVIVDNSGGAGGSLGIVKALRAPADGYTVIMTSGQDIVQAPLSYKAATFKPEDFKTVAMVGRTSIMVVVRKDLKANNLGELVAQMKAASAKPLSYCTPGNATTYRLIGERMNALMQTSSLHVPYPGFGQCLTDLAGGVIDFAFVPIAGPFPGIVDKGDIRVIAVIGNTPSPRFPNAPLASATKGFETFNYSLWAGLHVDRKVPDAVVDTLNKAVMAALAKPDVRKTIESSGAAVFFPMTPQQAQAYFLKEAQDAEAMAKAVGLTRE